VARFEDYPRIAQLEAAHGMETQPEADWRHLWLDNPLWPRLGERWPIGWVLEDAGGQLVGSVVNVPSLYRFKGRELICGNGRAWVARPEYRSFALLLMDEYFTQEGADLFVNNTVAEVAEQLHSTLSERIPLGDWETIAYWVTGYLGFGKKALEKMHVPLSGVLAPPVAAGLWLKDALTSKRLPSAPASVTIAAAEGFDARFDGFWEELLRLHPEKLLAARDSKTLAWHYAIPMRRGRLWILTASRGGLLRAWCVLKRWDLREGVKRMRLIDYQTLEPDADLLPGLLGAALSRSRAEGLYVLEHLGCGLPKMRTFDAFAPYRRRLPNWPFFGHAVDPALNAELRKPEVWDPSGYDGDASFE
jgi:hypothetical protein